MDNICEICNKQATDIQEQYVPAKQTVMWVCDRCRHTYVTYSPDAMDMLPTGDVHLDN